MGKVILWFKNLKKNFRARTNTLKSGVVVAYYVCKFSARAKKGYRCTKELKAVYPADSSLVEVFESGHIHEDDPSDESMALNSDVKKAIVDGIKAKKTALMIQQSITVFYRNINFIRFLGGKHHSNSDASCNSECDGTYQKEAIRETDFYA